MFTSTQYIIYYDDRQLCAVLCNVSTCCELCEVALFVRISVLFSYFNRLLLLSLVNIECNTTFGIVVDIRYFAYNADYVFALFFVWPESNWHLRKAA